MVFHLGEVGTVVGGDGLTAAPFRFGDSYYLVYVDRKRGVIGLGSPFRGTRTPALRTRR
ncbi:hypothetical protein [Vulcanisaeta distributa]|uniref:hypothetical protein n=1 Tax=Vulcanisaeta distributa TaxID=164451 RepID=UPI000AC2FE5A|nr:hypothetical protein [Vulcanisaeta distributa]